jgi:hypothetical protein
MDSGSGSLASLPFFSKKKKEKRNNEKKKKRKKENMTVGFAFCCSDVKSLEKWIHTRTRIIYIAIKTIIFE